MSDQDREIKRLERLSRELREENARLEAENAKLRTIVEACHLLTGIVLQEGIK